MLNYLTISCIRAFANVETPCRSRLLFAFLTSLQVLESVQLKQEVTHIEEERIQVLNNIEELEQKIKDLDNQMEESLREVRSTVVSINTADTRAFSEFLIWFEKN